MRLTMVLSGRCFHERSVCFGSVASAMPATHTHTPCESERGMCVWRVTQGRGKGGGLMVDVTKVYCIRV